jgi:hypothetical protein
MLFVNSCPRGGYPAKVLGMSCAEPGEVSNGLHTTPIPGDQLRFDPITKIQRDRNHTQQHQRPWVELPVQLLLIEIENPISGELMQHV